MERLEDSTSTHDVVIPALATQVSANIMMNLSWMLDQKIANEAELRFCIGDPILCGICDAWQI